MPGELHHAQHYCCMPVQRNGLQMSMATFSTRDMRMGQAMFSRARASVGATSRWRRWRPPAGLWPELPGRQAGALGLTVSASQARPALPAALTSAEHT